MLVSAHPADFIQHNIPEGRTPPTEISNFDHCNICINVEGKYTELPLVVLNLGRIDFAILVQGVTILHLAFVCFDHVLVYSPGCC